MCSRIGLNASLTCVLVLLILTNCANSPDDSFNQGLRLLEAQQISQAEEQFLAAVEATPKNAEAWNQLGIIAFERGDLEEAKIRFESAAKQNPLHPAYRRNSALVFAEQKEYDVALQLLNNAIELDPFDADTYLALAKVAWLNGKPDQAAMALNHAMKMDPANKEAQELASMIQP